MPRTGIRSRIVAAGALVAAVAATAPAAPAAAATVQLDGGTTTMTLDQRTAATLRALKVALTPVDPATAVRGGVELPITGGAVDPATAAGSVEHGGGLQLRARSKRFRLTALVVDTKSGTVSGTTGRTSVRAFKLSRTGAKVRREGFGTSLVGARVTVTSAGAAAINRALGVHALKRGATLGLATVRTQPAELVVRGTTSLALDAGFRSLLQGQGIRVAPAAPAAAGAAGTLAFPIDHGRLNARSLAGSIAHRGGLSFTRGTTVARFTGLGLRTAGLPALTARLAGSGMELLTLDVSRATESDAGRRLTLGNVVGRLTPQGADALNRSFATTAFTAGATVATATVAARVR